MDGDSISGAESGGQSPKRGKKTSRRSPGLEVIARGGFWHIHGTVRLPTGSVRVRRATGLEARKELKPLAESERHRIETELRDEAIFGRKPGVSVAFAAHSYLTAPRERPVGAEQQRIAQRISRKFATRDLRSIKDEEWSALVNELHGANKPSTRERFIGGVCAILSWCMKKPRGWIDAIPAFDRDNEARNPNRRARRRVDDLSSPLIMHMLAHAAPHYAAQLAVMWSTGARVSSLLYGARVCDLILAPGREQITFIGTKNGEDVTAALHPFAAKILGDYLEWRGDLHDREAPLFLTHVRKPYLHNGFASGGQNKTAFNRMKQRAAASLLATAEVLALEAEQHLRPADARELRADAADKASLLLRVTQHWFRHMLATKMQRGGDLRTTMDQGGWLDPRSVIAYSLDVIEYRRQIVSALDIGTSLTQADDADEKHSNNSTA